MSMDVNAAKERLLDPHLDVPTLAHIAREALDALVTLQAEMDETRRQRNEREREALHEGHRADSLEEALEEERAENEKLRSRLREYAQELLK